MKSDKNTGLTSSLQKQFSRIVIILMMIMILKQPINKEIKVKVHKKSTILRGYLFSYTHYYILGSVFYEILCPE